MYDSFASLRKIKKDNFPCDIHHRHHVPGPLQTSAMAFQSSLSIVLLMSSLLGDSLLVTELFRLCILFMSFSAFGTTNLSTQYKIR